MKCSNELISLTSCNYLVINAGEYLCIPPHTVDIWCTNKRHWNPTNTDKVTFRVKTSQLPAVGVSDHFDIHRSQIFPVIITNAVSQKYQTGAGSENRQSSTDFFPNGIEQSKFAHQLALYSAFSSRNHKPVK